MDNSFVEQSVPPLSHLTERRQRVVRRVLDLLNPMPDLVAVALGGSCATGNCTENSDFDFGLYYREKAPFSIEAVKGIARILAGDRNPTVTEFYEWGAWVNGGAWIQSDEGKIDFLYRNIDQVERTINNALGGRIENDYCQQAPYGFRSIIYLAETSIAIPLYDPEESLLHLKEKISRYPEMLQASIITESLWSAEFTLNIGADYALSGDAYCTVGCLARAAASLTQVLFALNKVYFLGDKRAMAVVNTFPRQPVGYVKNIQCILANPGSSSESLVASVEKLKQVWNEVVDLTDGMYRPKYIITDRAKGDQLK